ncbi:MAG: hypothetical protein ACRCYS_00405, partial [Beijerinckiaceae bacterium]
NPYAKGGIMPGTTTFTNLGLGKGVKSAVAVAGAATLNQPSGRVTSEALATAAAGTYTLTLTCPYAQATDIVVAQAAMGTSTTGLPVVATAKPANGSVVFVVQNIGAAVLNGTIIVSYVILRG